MFIRNNIYNGAEHMSDLFEHKGYNGTIEYSAADNVMFGKVLGIRGLLSYEGNSLESLRLDFEDVVDDYLETCAEEGIEPEKPYKGINTPIDHHKTLGERFADWNGEYKLTDEDREWLNMEAVGEEIQ